MSKAMLGVGSAKDINTPRRLWRPCRRFMLTDRRRVNGGPARRAIHAVIAFSRRCVTAGPKAEMTANTTSMAPAMNPNTLGAP
jgi:hypothetical protein